MRNVDIIIIHNIYIVQRLISLAISNKMYREQKVDKSKGTESIAPFGNPDGSRAAIEDVIQGFVAFGSSSEWGGLSTQDDDLTVRVIVGKKGSGKTVYLRRLQAYASNQPDLYADDIQQSLPSTENIIKFCQFFEEKILTEKWMLLWHRAILRSITSHLINSDRIKMGTTSRRMETLLAFEKDKIIRNFTTPMSIYSQVSEIINMFETRNQITKFLDDPRWPELEYRIAETIKDLPPLCFYVDAVDEEFAHAPMYWQRCQKGLFYQTMRLLRDARLGGRLHIVICIRDIVLSAIYRSEHRTRYRKEPHIRILKWDRYAISYFLNQKIQRLDERFFIGNPKIRKDTESWLGIKKIHNNIRNYDELVEDYLIRHTRLLPRDIVNLGNSLCETIEKAKKRDEIDLLNNKIRDTVSEEAKFFGEEQLIICGNQIASDQIPKRAALHEYSDIYTGNQEYIRGIAEDLKKLIKYIGKDRFTKAEFERAQDHALTAFNNNSDPFSVLWQNGLIGYVKYGETPNLEEIKFYSESSDYRISLEEDNYAFHSCLIDSVGISPLGLPIKY